MATEVTPLFFPDHKLHDFSVVKGRRRQKRIAELQAIQEEVNEQGFSLEQHLALRELLPDTFASRLQWGDMLPFAKVVKKEFTTSRLEGSRRQKALKITRQWAGLSLGTFAFWALPWPALKAATMPMQMLRSTSAMTPYFLLNLPQSATQYKTIASSVKELVTFPVSLGRLAVWEIKDYKRNRQREKEIIAERKTQNDTLSRKQLKREAREQVQTKIAEAKEKAERKYFESTYSGYANLLASVLPEWHEEDRMAFLKTELAALQKRAYQESGLILIASLVLPLIFFKIALMLAGTTLTGVFPPAGIAITASLATMILRNNILRLFLSSKKAKADYTREKIGNTLLKTLELMRNEYAL